MTKYRRRHRDLLYLAWIRTQCCVCCGTWRNVQAAHVGAHAAYRKCPDTETIPLCFRHHLWEGGKESYHQLGKRFWSHWKLNRDRLVTYFQRRYAEEHPERVAA